MIPKIDFQVHQVFINAFFSPRTYGPKEKLDEDIKNFVEFFNVHSEAILSLINRFSGYEWIKDRIPVYIIPNHSFLNFSFSTPELENGLPGIVQKIGLGKFRDVHIHIHELTHVNQRDPAFSSRNNPYVINEKGERNVRGIELTADLVTLHVLRAFFGVDSEYEKDFIDFLSNTNEKNKMKFEELNKYKDKWDLNKQPLRNYIEEEILNK